MRLSLLFPCLAVCLTGCANSVYFYETEKFTLATLEGRPDPSQPVQLNVGFKQRVVAMAPPSSKNGEATSIYANFNLDRRPKSDSEDGGVTIKTRLFTGAAATSLTTDQRAQVLAGIPKIASWDDLAQETIDYAKRNNKLTLLRQVAQTDYAQLTDNAVRDATGLERLNYPLSLHAAINKQLGALK